MKNKEFLCFLTKMMMSAITTIDTIYDSEDVIKDLKTMVGLYYKIDNEIELTDEWLEYYQTMEHLFELGKAMGDTYEY